MTPREIDQIMSDNLDLLDQIAATYTSIDRPDFDQLLRELLPLVRVEQYGSAGFRGHLEGLLAHRKKVDR